jgi:hypothetical protein
MQNASPMQIEQRSHSTPYGWIGFFVVLAVVAYIGLSRHRDVQPPIQTIVTAGTSAHDRAESAQVAAQLRTVTAPVDARRLVHRIDVQDDSATVTIDQGAYAALSPEDQNAVFEAVGALWTRAYRAQHGQTLDRPISFDFVDTSGAVVHHTQIDPQ